MIDDYYQECTDNPFRDEDIIFFKRLGFSVVEHHWERGVALVFQLTTPPLTSYSSHILSFYRGRNGERCLKGPIDLIDPMVWAINVGNITHKEASLLFPFVKVDPIKDIHVNYMKDLGFIPLPQITKKKIRRWEKNAFVRSDFPESFWVWLYENRKGVYYLGDNGLNIYEPLSHSRYLQGKGPYVSTVYEMSPITHNRSRNGYNWETATKWHSLTI